MITDNRTVRKNNRLFKIFDIRRFPMDLGRALCLVCPLLLRMKRRNEAGEKYRGKVRGGALIVSNHSSFSDPFIVGVCFWYRRMFCLAAETVMRIPIVALLLRGMGCIKIDRTINDIEAIKKSVSLLRDGHLLAMFPQGGLERDGEVDHIKSGAVLIAVQAGVPIIPMYAKKRSHWYERQLAVIGKPLVCSDYCKKKMPSVSDLESVSSILLERMDECKETYDNIVQNH